MYTGVLSICRYLLLFVDISCYLVLLVLIYVPVSMCMKVYVYRCFEYLLLFFVICECFVPFGAIGSDSPNRFIFRVFNGFAEGP